MTLFLKQSGSPTVQNLAATEGVETSVSFNAYTKKLLLQNRGNGDLKLAFASGETATNYFTLKGSTVYFEDFISGPFTIYILADETTTIEIVTWTHRV